MRIDPARAGSAGRCLAKALAAGFALMCVAGVAAAGMEHGDVADRAAAPARTCVLRARPSARMSLAHSSLLRLPVARAARSSAFAPGASGMRAAIDPETGALGPPNAEQLRALDSGLRSAPTAAAPVRISVLEGGVREALLGDRFLEYLVAVRDSAGRIETRCVHGTPSFEWRPRPAAGAPAEQ